MLSMTQLTTQETTQVLYADATKNTQVADASKDTETGENVELVDPPHKLSDLLVTQPAQLMMMAMRILLADWLRNGHH